MPLFIANNGSSAEFVLYVQQKRFRRALCPESLSDLYLVEGLQYFEADLFQRGIPSDAFVHVRPRLTLVILPRYFQPP